jgi:hypothetical protein
MMPGNRTLVDFPAPQNQGANQADPATPEGVPDYQSAFPRHAPADPAADAKPFVNLQTSSVPPRPPSSNAPPLIPPPAPPMTSAQPTMAKVEKPVIKPVGIDTVKPVAPPKPAPVAAAPAPAAAAPGPKVVRGGINWRQWGLAALVVFVIGQGVVIAWLVNSSSNPTPPPPVPVAAAPAPIVQAPVVLPPAAPVPPAQGHVEVSSDPDGAKVLVDGTERGVTPLTLSLDPGSHSVVITDGRSTTTRTLEVAAGANVTLAATLAPAGLAAGYVTIASPIELQVFENGQVLGTTASPKLLLPAGRHELEVVNEALEFRTKINLEVRAGQTSRTNVTMPNGSISVNALPWAVVWIDGKDVGTTPIATMTVPIGNHEVIWRHPQFGERKQTVTVTAKMPVRLVMDFAR